MTTIHELTDNLLEDRKVVEWLRLADIYMQSYNKAPKHFVLPRAHAHLKPLIEAYANNLPGFVRYILGVRDSYTHDVAVYDELNRLYRTISTRELQQQRRERVGRAIDKALEKRGRPVSFDTRMRYARMLEQDWGKRRITFLDEHRAKTQRNRLSIEERAELLEGFWKSIDDEIAIGDLPPMEGD